MRTLIITGGQVIDPKNGLNKTADVLIEDGSIIGVDAGVNKNGAEIIDAKGKVVCLGLLISTAIYGSPGLSIKRQ